jgi:hypothetical protein
MSGLERAMRYDIRMEMRYRASGETEWREAETENISRTGVLFRAREALDVTALVEMCFRLPEETAGQQSAEVFCQGWVVRSMPPASVDRLPMMAARILDYQFIREAANGEKRESGQCGHFVA